MNAPVHANPMGIAVFQLCHMIQNVAVGPSLR
jgi:hypothetical protein